MFRHTLLKIIVIVSCCVGLPAYGDSQTVTLDQVMNLAIENNLHLKAAKARLGVSKAEIKTAGARPNPNLVSDNGIAEDTYRAGIEQTLELGGKRRKRKAVAKAQMAVVQSEVDQTLLEIRTRVRRAYTHLYLTQEREKALQEIVSGTEKLLTVSQKQEEAGDIAQLDVLHVDIAVVNAKNDLQTLVNEKLEARNQLNALLNQPLGTSLVLSAPENSPRFDKTLVNLDNFLEAALSHRPEIFQNERQMTVVQKQLSLAHSKQIPDLSVTAGPDIVTGDNNQFNAFFIANMELPAWNHQQGPIAEAKARNVLLEKEREALKNKITLEVTNAYNAFYAHQDRVMRYETELFPKAQSVARKSLRSFEEGKASVLIPLNAQQAYVNTRLGYLQAMADLQNAISDLERAVGTGL